MKKTYQKPAAALIKFHPKDILTASGTGIDFMDALVGAGKIDSYYGDVWKNDYQKWEDE